MIAFIEGRLIECHINAAIVQTGGIGYEINIPLTTSEKLPSLGKDVKLYTQATYREDSQTLYGFIDRESRDFFKMIVDKVSGIGPKIALNLLGSLSLPTLKTSIASGDVGMLSKAQGLGKKPQKELWLNLRTKFYPKQIIVRLLWEIFPQMINLKSKKQSKAIATSKHIKTQFQLSLP